MVEIFSMGLDSALTCVRRGEFSCCTTLKLDELPPNTLKNSPEYCELISDHSNVGQIVLGSGWPGSWLYMNPIGIWFSKLDFQFLTSITESKIESINTYFSF